MLCTRCAAPRLVSYLTGSLALAWTSRLPCAARLQAPSSSDRCVCCSSIVTRQTPTTNLFLKHHAYRSTCCSPFILKAPRGNWNALELCIANKQRKVDRAGVLEDQAAVSSFVVALHSTACPPPVSHRESCRQRSSDVGCGTPLLSFFCVFCVFSFFLVCCVVAGKVRHQEKYR